MFILPRCFNYYYILSINIFICLVFIIIVFINILYGIYKNMILVSQYKYLRFNIYILYVFLPLQNVTAFKLGVFYTLILL
jgi:hypothetical protein